MKHLRNFNESMGDISDLDWSLIKDCLLEVFDSVDDIKGQFHFYSCNFNYDWHYKSYKEIFASIPYHNYTGIKDIFTYDPETSKRENQQIEFPDWQETGDIFLRSYPNGSGLWGVEFEFELDSFPDVKSSGDLDSVTSYFNKCKNISEDIASTIERLGSDYRIGLEQGLTKKGTTGIKLGDCYLIKISIWDREVREIMEKEYTTRVLGEKNWIN